MARLSLRLLGLGLLTFAIGVSSCQSLFPRAAAPDVPLLSSPVEEGRLQ